MPTPDYNADHPPASVALSQALSLCPAPATQQSEHEQDTLRQSQEREEMHVDSGPSSDNTGAGMAQSQEDSMYLTPAASPQIAQEGFIMDDTDRMDILHEEIKEGAMTPKMMHTQQTIINTAQRITTIASPSTSPQICAEIDYAQDMVQSPEAKLESQRQDAEEIAYLPTPSSSNDDYVDLDFADDALSKGLAPIDLTFDRSTQTKSWTFSHRRLLPNHPSCVFQPFSRYTGTQQSDRQTYNVDVTILTVDVEQCTLAGYLLIRGLTPEHDTLQTYFTGEIIGGPPKYSNEKQPYTFRTSTPAWGATEKTDLTHWARFPAWRSLSSHAKRDINFAYPTDDGNWWEQENIFMRWKEHFLVPDHKTKSIAGASFEGFYYICLNQIQGRISGIYYHSKSEK